MMFLFNAVTTPKPKCQDTFERRPGVYSTGSTVTKWETQEECEEKCGKVSYTPTKLRVLNQVTES